GRVHLVEGLRTGITPGGRAARDHAYVRRGLVTGLTGRHGRRHRRVAGDRERRSGQARTADLEATRIDVARRMTARAVAVEGAEGEVVARGGEEGDVGEGGGDGRAVAGGAIR